MTINAIDLSAGSASALKNNSGAAASSPSASSASNLTQEEKNYDVNNDGILEPMEKAAMLAAETQKETVASGNNSGAASNAVTINISQKALDLQKQNPTTSEELEKAYVDSRNKADEQGGGQNYVDDIISEYKQYSPPFAS